MDRREDGETAAQNRGRTAYPANISETRMPPPDLQFQGHAGETRERTHDMSPNVDESLNATLQLDPSSLWCALQKQSMTNGMCESENADHQSRCHAVSKANRANAGSDLALLQKNLERSTAESSELQARVATLERQVDQYRGALKREQQRSALYEKILSAKQREIERMEDTPFKGQLASPLRTPLRDKMADGGRIPFSVSSAASAGSLAQSECKRGERSLRLAGRELLSDSRAVRRQELLLEGIVANEVLPNNMQSLFTWTKRSRLVPRGLFISLDRTTLIISDRPDGLNILLDKRFPLEEVEVEFGLQNPESASLVAALPEPVHAWQCFSIASRSQRIHLQVASDELALNSVLAVQQLTARLRLASRGRAAARKESALHSGIHSRTDDGASVMTPRKPLFAAGEPADQSGFSCWVRCLASSERGVPRECDLLWQRARMRLAAAAAERRQPAALVLAEAFRQAAAAR